MKKLHVLALMATLGSASNAMAGDTYKLPGGALALRGITGELKEVRVVKPESCPVDTICETYSVAVLEFPVGCGNALGPVSITGTTRDGKKHLTVSALEVMTDLGTRADCALPRKAQVEVTLDIGLWSKDEVEVTFQSFFHGGN